MVDKQANIDLVFRNGLREYEVLPPPEVWNSILPSVRKKQSPTVLLRAAALALILVSVSVLAYQLTRQTSIPFDAGFLAFDQESSRAGTILMNTPVAVPVTENRSELPVSDNPPTQPLYDQEPEAAIPSATIQTTTITLLNNDDDREGLHGTLSSMFIRQDDPEDFFANNYGQVPAPPPVTEKINRWSVTAMASPTYQSALSKGSGEMAREILSTEQTNFSYTGGLSFSYRVSDKFSIQSGLYYSSLGQEVGGISAFGGFSDYTYSKGDHNFEVMTSSGLVYTNNADIFLFDGVGGRVNSRFNNDTFDPAKASLNYINSSIHQNFSYIEMPVFLRYKVVDGTVGFNIIGGFSYNMLVNNSVYAVFEGDKYRVGKTEGVSNFMLSSSLGMGLEYTVTDNLSLNLEPTFRYYLNPFSTMPGLKNHPYSIGVFSGLSYKF